MHACGSLRGVVFNFLKIASLLGRVDTIGPAVLVPVQFRGDEISKAVDDSSDAGGIKGGGNMGCVSLGETCLKFWLVLNTVKKSVIAEHGVELVFINVV